MPTRLLKKVRDWLKQHTAKINPIAHNKKLSPINPNSIVICTQLDSNNTTYWKISQEGVLSQPVEHITSAVVSFTRADIRVKTPIALSIQAAKSFAIRESEASERLRVINHSKTTGLIYATPENRLNNTHHPLIPGLAILDQLIIKHQLSLPLLTGFVFEGPTTNQTKIAIIVAIRDKGKYDITVQINGDLEMQCQAFAAQAKISNTASVMLFSTTDFIEAISTNIPKAYPKEAEWHGYPIRNLLLASFFIATSLALMSTLFAGYQYYKLSTLQTLAHADAQANEDIQEKIGITANTIPVQFSALLGLDIDLVLATAESLWIKNSQIHVVATPQEQTYLVTLTPSQQPSLDTPGEIHNTLSELTHLPTPNLCQRLGIASTGTLNEYQIQIICHHQHAPFNDIIIN